MASISSMNNRQGATRYYGILAVVKSNSDIYTFASSNVSLSVFSDSPDIPDTIDGAEMLMKGTSSSCKKIIAGTTMKRLTTYPSHRMSEKRLSATWRTMK
jgi:hypothetical protein